MHLDVAHPQGAVDFDLGVEEVGACVRIVQTRIDDLYAPSAARGERSEGEQLVLPYVVEQFFHAVIALGG